MRVFKKVLVLLFFTVGSRLVAQDPPGNYIRADQHFTGGPAERINACITSLATTGGTCDARAYNGTQTMDEEIDLTGGGAYGITLLLPDSGLWQFMVSNSSQCGIFQDGNTTLLGNAVGGGGARFKLEPMNPSTFATSLSALYCTNSQISGGGYFRASGFGVIDPYGITWGSNALVDISGFDDESTWDHIFAEVEAIPAGVYTDAVHVAGDSSGNGNGGCCGAGFYFIQGFATGGGNALVLGSTQSGAATKGVSFYGSTFNVRGGTTTGYNIEVLGGNNTWGNNFYGTYMEGNGAAETILTMVYNDAIGTAFFGPTLNTEVGAMSTKPGFTNGNGITHYYNSLRIENANFVNTSVCVMETVANVASQPPCSVHYGSNYRLTHYETNPDFNTTWINTFEGVGPQTSGLYSSTAGYDTLFGLASYHRLAFENNASTTPLIIPGETGPSVGGRFAMFSSSGYDLQDSSAGAVHLINQSGNIAASTLASTTQLTTQSPGSFIINCAAAASASSSGSLTYTLSFSDPFGVARTYTSPSLSLSISGAQNVWAPVTLQVSDSTALTVATTLTNTATYNFDCSALRLY